MSSTTQSKKTAKKESQSSISLDEIKARVMSQDPSKWSLECIQQYETWAKYIRDEGTPR